MKNHTYILAASLLSASCVFADQAPDTTKSIEANYHRVYAGPDIFYCHQKGSNSSVKYNAVFEGLRLGYDYIKAMGEGSTKSKYRTSYYSDFKSYKIKNTPLFINLEDRFGYNFQSSISPKSTLTPFAGIGWYGIRAQYDARYNSSNWFYGALGLRVNHQFYDSFDLGFNFKGMYSFAGKTKDYYGSQTLKNGFGYEIALPCTWYFGASKVWDMQFQPYLLKLDTKAHGQIVGVRLQAGYNF